MGWFNNIKIIKEMKENKAIYKLTADIDDVADISEWRIKELIESELVRGIASQLRQQYVEDLVKSIDVETIRAKALEAFKDDIRASFAKKTN